MLILVVEVFPNKNDRHWPKEFWDKVATSVVKPRVDKITKRINRVLYKYEISHIYDDYDEHNN